jgi:hypothetical protein
LVNSFKPALASQEVKRVKILDLSLPLEESASEPSSVEMIHELHKQGVNRMKTYFGWIS